eukprot:13119759-Alexandrium_andersonii.AAC.1
MCIRDRSAQPAVRRAVDHISCGGVWRLWCAPLVPPRHEATRCTLMDAPGQRASNSTYSYRGSFAGW